MDKETYQRLREAAADESLSYGDLIEIQGAFEAIPDEQLRDLRENATADDMLDEIASFFGLAVPLCKYESSEPGTLLCVLPMGHEGQHETVSYK